MKKRVTFHDYKPKTVSFKDAVIKGLSKAHKSIPPKFFYDERGSQLFDLICQQPEYYPPMVERQILTEKIREISDLIGQGRVLLEPGAGSLDKVRLLLDALRPIAYLPMDISFAHMKSAAHALFADYPWLPIHAVQADFTETLPLPDQAPDGPRLVFFPGSSIGNLDQQEAGVFLAMLKQAAGTDGMILIGVDTKKPVHILQAAYNDAYGATAAFNLNLLHRMNSELGANCDPANFEHRSFYNKQAGRIEMHLVSRQKQSILLNGTCFEFEKGETLHTENSYKYAPEEFLLLAKNNGLKEVRHWMDKDELFAIYLLETR